MGRCLHGCARATEAIRRAIHHSQERLRALARRHGVNPKPIAKWRACTDVADRRTGLAEPRSTTLSAGQEPIIVAFRRHTLLPLDDCLKPCSPQRRSQPFRCIKPTDDILAAIQRFCRRVQQSGGTTDAGR
jgi:transposase-like protein